jgi:predicted Zn-dependent peptidase
VHTSVSRRPATTRTLLRSSGGGAVRRTVLPNGVRVVSEAMPTVRSVSFGVWVGVGSRDEGRTVAGASHYLEHLLFKGTRRRDALAISAEVEAVGGEINAFTAKEYTCYYARVLDEDLPLAVDVVADMVTSSRLASADVESERDVILEEIAMHDDEPGDAVHDVFAEALYGDGPLGRPILGTVESINALSRTSINGYYRRRYLPRNLVVAAAGNLDHRKLVRMVRRAFDMAGLLDGADAAPSSPRIGGVAQPTFARVRHLVRPTEQAHLILGVPGVPRTDERRFALGVLNAALGGGMSSRLFQEIRETRGLAYSVYSYAAQYADSGFVGVYAGCQPRKITEVLALCREQLADVAERGITADELARAKGQMRGGLVLGLEDTGSRMSRIGKAELVYDELLGIDQVLDRIDAVTLDDVHDVARLLGAAPTLAVMSPKGSADRFARAVR